MTSHWFSTKRQKSLSTWTKENSFCHPWTKLLRVISGCVCSVFTSLTTHQDLTSHWAEYGYRTSRPITILSDSQVRTDMGQPYWRHTTIKTVYRKSISIWIEIIATVQLVNSDYIQRGSLTSVSVLTVFEDWPIKVRMIELCHHSNRSQPSKSGSWDNEGWREEWEWDFKGMINPTYLVHWQQWKCLPMLTPTLPVAFHTASDALVIVGNDILAWESRWQWSMWQPQHVDLTTPMPTAALISILWAALSCVSAQSYWQSIIPLSVSNH